MSLWEWLLENLTEFPGDGKKGPKGDDRYVLGGVDRFMGKDMDQVKDRFRDAFGDHYGGDDEDDGDD